MIDLFEQVELRTQGVGDLNGHFVVPKQRPPRMQ
jgi:hypothetical protein